MGTWSMWENQFLNAAGILITPPCRQFLDQWAANASHPNCTRNPIDLSTREAGSNRCAANSGIHPTTFTYSTHAHAATAFNTQIHESWASAILHALNTGNPFQPPSDPNAVRSALVSWGSVKFANAYQSQPTGGGGGGTGVTGIHKGWADLQRSLSRSHLGAKIKATNSMDAAALRKLSHLRKVR